jgi:hypothetical protein
MKPTDKSPELRALMSKAHSQVYLARKQGILDNGPCEVCGSPHVDGHHEDYTKPLEVRWLCSRHHLRYHTQKNSRKVRSLDQFVEETRANPKESTYTPVPEYIFYFDDGSSFTFNSEAFFNEFRERYQNRPPSRADPAPPPKAPGNRVAVRSLPHGLRGV